jgi:hypothetical protein
MSLPFYCFSELNLKMSDLEKPKHVAVRNKNQTHKICVVLFVG